MFDESARILLRTNIRQKLTNRLFVGVKDPIRQKNDELPFELEK